MSYQELAMGVNSRQFNQELKKREKEDLHDLLTPKKKKKVFIIGDWNAKYKSRATWSNRQIDLE